MKNAELRPAIAEGTYRRINALDFKIPRHFSPDSADLVRAVSARYSR